MIRVAIVGGSGYVGGELLRLLLAHPHVEVTQVTSERRTGQYLHSVHPHLRGQTCLRFTSAGELVSNDLLLLALPHGVAARNIERYTALAPRIIDCSTDFRLADPESYARWYGSEHPTPEWLSRFVYGLPEVNRDRIRQAHYVSGVGCNATAVTLALLPLVQAGLIEAAQTVVVEVKVGSSEGGNEANDASHHPARAGVVRSFAPVGHRHTAEVAQALGLAGVHLSITGVELVRGALATAHLFPTVQLDDKQLWRAYRAAYRDEPFVRIVHEQSGLHRHPEPRLLAGTNFADVGWSVDATTGRVVALAAIDNLGKGAAGTAVQCLSLMHGFDEETALGFRGLYPG